MKSYFIITMLIYICKDKHDQEYLLKPLPLNTFYEYKTQHKKLFCGVFIYLKLMDTEQIYQATSNSLEWWHTIV